MKTEEPKRREKFRQAAEVLGVSPFSLADRRFRERHGIPAIRIGRALIFDIGQLEAYLANRRETFTHKGDGGGEAA